MRSSRHCAALWGLLALALTAQGASARAPAAAKRAADESGGSSGATDRKPEPPPPPPVEEAPDWDAESDPAEAGAAPSPADDAATTESPAPGEPAPRKKKRDPDFSPPRTAEDPRPTALGGADRVQGEELANVVAFTFDDGPDPHTTPVILDALARYRIPAAFFVVNRHIVGHRGKAGLPILARAVADGHLIGGHTANHARLRTTDGETLNTELDGAVQVLQRAAGVPVELFRPPYGSLGPTAAKRVRRLGLTDVRWSVDPRDFEIPEESQLRQAVLSAVNRDRGGIVLLHDTKRVTAAAIGKLFADLERDNCKRLARGAQPILPVSLHYFLRDEGVPRPVPPAVAARTEAYLRYLGESCEGKKPASDVAARRAH